MKKRLILHIILLSISIIIFQKYSIAQKTDTIYHINGNILTGDLKKMVYGVLTWKMDGMGTISFEEPKINSIKSQKLFEIKLKSGLIYFGSFDSSNINRKVYIVNANKRTLIDIDNIVEIYPIRKNFWRRTTGSFSLGANFSKGSQVGTINVSGNLNYRKRKSFFSLSWDDNNTFQGDSLSSAKADVGLAWQRYIKNRWSIELSTGLSQNTELGSKSKWDLNLIGIKDLAYNSWNRFYMGAGFAFSRETPFDGSNVTEDLTGIVQAVWKVFKYSNPKVWVDADVSFLPYFTGDPRYRAIFNLNPQVSLFSNNFKMGISFYYNYDSRPASDGASTNDYGVNLQVSYSLH